jgi:multiple sugar transport system substrate-binding protein
VKKSRLILAAAAAGSVLVALVGCTAGGGSGTNNGKSNGGSVEHATDCTNKIKVKSAPTVTVWAWYPNMAKVVDNFNNAHKDVQVCWRNAGAGGPEYDKFQTAVSAKKGAPDVVMLEADHLTNFEIQGALVDISKYGANKVKGNFSAGAWKDVSVGDAV